mgnify:CR=1 FL=1
MGAILKQCTQCGEWLSEYGYYKDRTRLQSNCKNCYLHNRKIQYKENSEKHVQAARLRRANPETNSKINTRRRAEHDRRRRSANPGYYEKIESGLRLCTNCEQ